MTWYKEIKIAAPAVYDPERALKSTKAPLDLANRFFTYLSRDKKAIKKLYHGTSAASYGKILDHYGMISPESTLSRQREFHPETQKQLFFTGNKDSANSYARQAGGTHQSKPVVLELIVPLYAIAEIRTAIFRPFINSDHGHYNEQGYHNHLSKIIQPVLQNIIQLCNGKPNRYCSAIEEKEFRKLSKEVIKYCNTKRNDNDEWTIAHQVGLRFIKNIYVGDGDEEKQQTIKQYNKGLTNQKALAKYAKTLVKSPGDYALLGIDAKNNPIIKAAVQQGWTDQTINELKNIQGNIFSYKDDESTVLDFMPNEFAQNKQISGLLQNTVPTVLKSLLEIKDLNTLSKKLKYIPISLQANIEVANIIKKKILELGVNKPKTTSELLRYLPKNIKTDNDFISNVAKTILQIEDPVELTDLQYVLPPQILWHPEVSKIILTSANPTQLQYERWPEEIIMKFAPQIQQNLITILSKEEPLSALNNLNHSAPLSELPDAIFQGELLNLMVNIAKKQITTVNLSSFLEYSANFPAIVMDYLKPEIVESIKTNGLNHWNWNVLPKDISNSPELINFYAKSKLEYHDIRGLDYTLLNPELKELYIETAITQLKHNPKIWNNCSPMILKLPAILEAAAEGYLTQMEYNNFEMPKLPPELQKNQKLVFQLTKSQIEHGGISNVNWDSLDESLKQIYITKTKENLIGDPSLFDNLPEEVKNIPEIAKSLADGWVNMIDLRIEKIIPSEVWELPQTQPYIKEMKAKLIADGHWLAFNHNSLDPNEKTQWYQKALETLSKSPSFYNQIPEQLKKDPKILSALIDGYMYSNLHIPETVINIPEMKALSPKIMQYETEKWGREIDYGYIELKNLFTTIPSNILDNPKFVILLTKTLLNINNSLYAKSTDGNFNGYTPESLKLINKQLKKAKLSPENYQKYYNAILKGAETQLISNLITNPYMWQHLDDSIKKMFPNAQKEALIDLLKDLDNNIMDELPAYSILATYGNSPEIMEIQNKLADKLINELKNNNITKEDVENFVKEFMPNNAKLNQFLMQGTVHTLPTPEEKTVVPVTPTVTPELKKKPLVLPIKSKKV